MRITADELEQRKKRIIYTAYELFCAYGIDAVPLAHIAKASKVSLNSIFRYFESKANLVKYTQKLLWDDLLGHLSYTSHEQRAATANGFEEIRFLLANFQSLYEQHSKYLLFAWDYKLFLMRHQVRLSETWYLDILAPVHAVFLAALKRGHADGSISNGTSEQIQFDVLWGMMRGFADQIVIFDQVYSGENPWKKQFDRVLACILTILTPIQPDKPNALEVSGNQL